MIICLDAREKKIHHEGCQISQLVAQRSCGISIFGDIKNLGEQNPQQPDLNWPYTGCTKWHPQVPARLFHGFKPSWKSTWQEWRRHTSWYPAHYITLSNSFSSIILEFSTDFEDTYSWQQRIYQQTISRNDKIVEVGRHLWRSSKSSPCLKTQSTRAVYSGPCVSGP